MFQLPIADVISELTMALQCVSDIVPYLDNIAGNLSMAVVDRLICYYKGPGNKYTTRIVSRYAATEFAIMQGPKLVDRLIGFLEDHYNRAMNGWFFELRFFSSLPCEDVVVHLRNRLPETWTKSDVEYFDPSRIETVPDGSFWWKPDRWNQGGYDAVFVNKDIGKVRFVQLTVAPSHSFRIQEFYKLLTQLKEHMEIKVLEIFFLSPEGKDLQISPVFGEGLLMEFGWEKGKEKDKVTRGWLARPPAR